MTLKVFKEHPIIFSTEMVKAILNGKTMTRRVIKPQPLLEYKGLKMQYHGKCPSGQVGDRLWVRETIAEWQGTIECVKNGDLDEAEALEYIVYKAGAKDWSGILKDNSYGHPWNIQPSIFMPRWASRITLEITKVRVGRVQEIGFRDCEAEGIYIYDDPWKAKGLSNSQVRMRFARLWDSINAKRGYGWKVNPWVWVISFKRLENARS